jgi:phosphofructokinase-like protein
MKRIGILTSGGDCPGLNAVIRAIVKKSVNEYKYEIIGIEDGFEGFIKNRHRKLTDKEVSGILTQGGTILGTSRANPYQYKGNNVSKQVISSIHKLKLSSVVCVGGDGSLSLSYKLFKDGAPMVGVPKTIDNDIQGTDLSFGFSTAVHIATEAVDRLHTTAESHHRVMILEVMGREAGWIALHAGTAGGGDIILLPEIPYDLGIITEEIKKRRRKGKRFTIIVAAEGAKSKNGTILKQNLLKDSEGRVRLGGISFTLGQQIEQLTGIETRNVVLGHLQRGGATSPFDRILGTELGVKALELVVKKNFGYMAALQNKKFVRVPLSLVAKGQKLVPLSHPLIETGRSIGTCFGF